MKIINILLCLLLVGCSTPNIVYKTQIKEVKVPIAMTIDRPSRPKYNDTDTVPSYMLRVIEYTKILETLIDENNKQAEATNDR